MKYTTVMFCCGYLALAGSLFAQSQPALPAATFSGEVVDARTGEALIGATVFVPALKQGAYTNEYGFFSLTLPPQSVEVVVRSLGYLPDTLAVDLTRGNVRSHLELASEETTTETVEITGNPTAPDQVRTNEMGVTSLSMQEVRKIPVLFGEVDVLKTLQLMPGVKSAGEGNSGFFVRGGGLDQNLILLDEAPVYNPSHLLGFFSVFNGDVINSTKLYKGNMPAEYGGRLSSVLDVRMKEGNSKDFAISGGIGLISSRLAIEGPLSREGKGSFMVAGRRTYADLFLGLAPQEAAKNSTLYFYDLNAKANYDLGERDKLYLSGYFGRDALGLSDRFGIDWGNSTATLRWNHLFSDKLFLNSTLIYSDFDYKINFTAAEATITSGIRDVNWKEDFSWYANSRNTLKFGLNAVHHTFTPGTVTIGSDSAENQGMALDSRYALETAAYVSHAWDPLEQLKLTYGLRVSAFTVLGPGSFYTYDPEGNITDSAHYAQNQVVTTYAGLEPRLNATWIFDERQSVKASYSRNRQYVHLLSNSTSGTPTDVWMPTSNNIAPEIADQVSLGYYRTLTRGKNRWEASAEGYYKFLQNQIDYQNGADILLNPTVESQLVYGKGYAYGLELLVKKNSGKLTGWVGYTLSRTLRAFDAINGGNPFPAKQDRIHDLSVVAMYALTPSWTISGNWVYYTGDAVTFPGGSYVVDGRLTTYYTGRNDYRLPAYHRMDLGATWTSSKRPGHSVNVSLYNAYGRKNVYTIDFKESTTHPGTIEAEKNYLFQWVPSVTWNFMF